VSPQPTSLAINETVKSGTLINWSGALKYNQFMEPHQRLRNEAQANMKISFITKKILFVDGTAKEYK
jgi:hypothetical protein